MFGFFTEVNLKNLWGKPQIGVSMSLKAWISMDQEITSSQWRIIEATSDQEPLEWDWYWWLHISASLHEKLKDLSNLAVVSSLNYICSVSCFCKQAHSPSALETKETQQQLSPESPGTEVDLSILSRVQNSTEARLPTFLILENNFDFIKFEVATWRLD
jgi:hypothetical protein